MSKSFAVKGGDLSIGAGRSLEIVDGQEKLLQDLKNWIMERIGTDPATPTFGSRLDGGMDNGRYVASMIGQPMSDEAVAEIKLQISELISRYRVFQLEKIQDEIARFGETTIKPEETISRLQKIEAIVLGDTVAVRAQIATLANHNLKIVVPILLTA